MPLTLPPDMHVHTNLSIDAKGTQLGAVDAAVASGLPGVGFTEHWDFDPDDPSTGRFDYRSQREALIALVDLCIGEAAVFYGAEVSYEKRFEGDIKAALVGKQFDYLIGSLHVIGETPIEKMADVLAESRPDEVYSEYFREYLGLVESGLFNVAGHLDYPKRYGAEMWGEFRYADYSGLIDPILRAVVQQGMVLEINTKGWRSAAAEQYPSVDILKRYKDLGGQFVTLGSDAHDTSEIGFNFPYALGLAKETGLDAVVFSSGHLFVWPESD